MNWYGIRTIYHFGAKSDGKNIFEERIVVFCGKTEEEAHEKASKEAEEYGKSNGFEVHPHQEGYLQDGDKLIDGYEVWSELYESSDNLNQFYKKKYSKYEYHPE